MLRLGIFLWLILCGILVVWVWFLLLFAGFLTLFLFCFAHSYLGDDQESIRKCPEANHVTCLGDKNQSFVLRKTQAEQLSGLEGKKYFCHSYSQSCRVSSFFPPWQPKAESILQDYWSAYPLFCSLPLWGSEVMLSFPASLQCYGTVSGSMKWSALT